MQYLISHFLAPGAAASTSGAPWFAGFTFDHVAEGVIAGCRRDDHRLYLIEVQDNSVTERQLWPARSGPGRFALLGDLPYELFLDEWEART